MQSSLRIQYWNVMVKMKRQRINSSPRIAALKAKMTEETIRIIEQNTRSYRAAFRRSVKDDKAIKKEHRKLRQEYLEDKLEELNLNEKATGKQFTSMRSLLAREQQRHDFAYIRSITKPSKGKGLTYIEVPHLTIPGENNQVIEPVVMETGLIDRNVGHFAQANSTPFAQNPILECLGYKGVNENSNILINGDEMPEALNNQPEYVQAILNKLNDGNNLPPFEETITFDEFKQGLCKWRERTITSPSGRHLGHYKLLTRLIVLDEDDDNINLSDTVLKVYFDIAIITARLGRALTRWTKISTCMIEKVKGLPRIDKLRVIHLFEADYNLLLKIVWARKTMWNMNDNNRIHDGQAGSRPGSRAIDVVIQKEMKYLYATLTRSNMGTIDNDAKSCFDRILCNVAMVISGYYGVPLRFRSMQAENLQNAIFRLQTGLGDSTVTYQHSTTTPIHGTGQGSCASPAIWLMISSFFMEILADRANGMTMHNILGQEHITQWIEGFVDDTSIFTNTSIKEIIFKN
jgi:Reverse transcriptase (RNA-dependent DNA polymerase)